jgi:signal transduction histidine kinase/GAF domain-containing protein
MWRFPHGSRWLAAVERWRQVPFSGAMTLIGGIVLITLLIWGFNSSIIVLPNAGLVYLPLVAMLAYHWGAVYAIIATLLQLFCVYWFFLPPPLALKFLLPQDAVQLLTLTAVTGFVLALVQLARERRVAAEHEARRFAALNDVGTALASELDKERLLHLIAETARNLTGAEFAAFMLQPANELGQPVEENLLHLAAVVGVTAEQERLLHYIPPGEEGVLAPIFRQGVPVRLADVQLLLEQTGQSMHSQQGRQDLAASYAQGRPPAEHLHARRVPRGHPLPRSFLGAPLLDSNRQVRGGLLLGHTEPGQFTAEDEALLVGLSAQAATAMENARLYQAAQMHAQELDAIFESIADGMTLVDQQGHILRENGAARRLREQLKARLDGEQSLEALLQAPARCALAGKVEQKRAVSLLVDGNEWRDYSVNATPLLTLQEGTGPLQQNEEKKRQIDPIISGAVVVWHDVTMARRLLIERAIHAETEARRALLQRLLDELPSSVYLVHGPDARLVLANRAATALWGASWSLDQPLKEFLQEHQIRIAHSAGRQLSIEQLATMRAVQQGETVYHHQEIIRFADGTTLPVLVNAVALRMNLFHMPSLQKEATHEAELAALVVLQDVSALKEAERLKDEFIGIAAHELRTPVAVLKGYAQMLILQTTRGRGPQLADWQKEALESIDQATIRLVELTEDLLDVTRVQAGRLEMHLQPTDLVALAKRVITRMQMTTEQHTLSFCAHVPYLVVSADPRRLEQVLSNLIGNALKYSPHGGSVEIIVEEDARENSARLCVRDHGIGIPQEQQARIFGRFARAENAKTHGIRGTGLGLYLCRELIERLEGRIWFESIEGQGSTFCIALPLHEGSSIAQE